MQCAMLGSGGLGEGSCDGTLARPYARGGYVAPGWPPPSRQGTEVPRRGVADARATRPFARAKRGPRSGVSSAAPRRATRKGLAPRSALDWVGAAGSPPSLLSETSAMGEAGPAGPGRRPQRRSRLPHSTSPSHKQRPSKKKRFFFDFFSARKAQAWPGGAPDGPRGSVRRPSSRARCGR
jgi:hypothetical protein